MAANEFQVDVTSQYVADQSTPSDDVYAFAYTITISNVGTVAAQLIARHWIIVDALGRIEEVNGLGVVGSQPLLKPGESFQYDSGCRLRTPTGTMHGSYFCVAENGEHFDVPIDLFVLEADTPNARVLH